MSVIFHHGQKAHDFLKQHKVGVLATVDPNSEPHAAAVYYDVDSQFNVYFLTKNRTKKADNLEHNKHAMLVVYEAETQTTVQVTGVVSEVTDDEELNKLFMKIVFASLDVTGSSVPPLAKLKEGEYVAYKLEPVQIRMAVFSKPDSGEYSDLFTTIVPEKD